MDNGNIDAGSPVSASLPKASILACKPRAVDRVDLGDLTRVQSGCASALRFGILLTIATSSSEDIVVTASVPDSPNFSQVSTFQDRTATLQQGCTTTCVNAC
eukprot:1803464-Amphidinium_carterae.2